MSQSWQKPEDAPEDTWVLTVNNEQCYHIAARYDEGGWQTLDGRRVSVDAWQPLPSYCPCKSCKVGA